MTRYSIKSSSRRKYEGENGALRQASKFVNELRVLANLKNIFEIFLKLIMGGYVRKT